jgi:hypothetical protein
MALEKVISEDKIEIVGDYKACTSTNLHQNNGRRRGAILWLPQARYHGWSGLQRRVSRSPSDLCSGSHGRSHRGL